MFKEYEDVMIKSIGRTGTIVDKVVHDGQAKYIVEDHLYINGEYPLHHCTDEDLEYVVPPIQVAI